MMATAVDEDVFVLQLATLWSSTSYLRAARGWRPLLEAAMLLLLLLVLQEGSIVEATGLPPGGTPELSELHALRGIHAGSLTWLP